VTPQSTQTNEPSTYVFSPRELQRLAVYRAAIAARFYTDECEPHTVRAPRQPIVGRAAALRRSAAHAPVV
jgi:hypothetical protein